MHPPCLRACQVCSHPHNLISWGLRAVVRHCFGLFLRDLEALALLEIPHRALNHVSQSPGLEALYIQSGY